jgi:uncharacterized RDD family membrane protein YckC
MMTRPAPRFTRRDSRRARIYDERRGSPAGVRRRILCAERRDVAPMREVQMTDPAGGAPTPPQPSGNWQAPQNPGGFQQANVEAGPAPGIAYADVVTRAIAAIIDGFIIGILFGVISIIGGIFAGIAGLGLLFVLIFGLIWAALTAVYFVYGWTKMRASFGQKFLNLETVSAADGSTLTQNQAIRRWAFLWGPIAVGYAIPIIGILIAMIGGLYQLYLLYTISQSPKRQGYHDVQAGTVVIKHG